MTAVLAPPPLIISDLDVIQLRLAANVLPRIATPILRKSDIQASLVAAAEVCWGADPAQAHRTADHARWALAEYLVAEKLTAAAMESSVEQTLRLWLLTATPQQVAQSMRAAATSLWQRISRNSPGPDP